MAEATTATVEQPHGGHAEVEPSALGLDASMWVAASMLVFLIVLVVKKVPSVITGGLDKQIAAIRQQLDEATQLRAEAEALRASYAARIANAEKEAAEMLAHASHEAELIVARAASDTADVIARREKMAAEKIEATERAAVEELRLRVVDLSTAAAASLIASHHGAEADRALVNSAIAGLVN